MAMAPHFFKVILFPPDQGLKIPIAFMRKYGDDLQKIVLLRVPTGATWRVELVNHDNRTWLEKGWREFAGYYSIKKWDFLVFRYDGNSQFHVLIFDPSATEIEYRSEKAGTGDEIEKHVSVEIMENFPRNRDSKVKSSQLEMEDLQDDVSVEILNDDLPVCKPRMRRSSRRLMSERNRNKKAKLENLNEADRSVGCSKPNIKKEQSCEGTERHLQSTVLAKDKFISYQRAKAFRSKKPFFMKFMQPTSVSGPFVLSFPLTFVKNYLTYRNKKCNLALRVRERQQTWTAICRVHAENSKVTCGWKVFVQENSLKVGDVCVFELESCNVFNIIIYRDE